MNAVSTAPFQNKTVPTVGVKNEQADSVQCT